MLSFQRLHQAGQLRDAEKGYLELLRNNPQDVTILHLLGLLYAEEAKFDRAQSYLEQALQLQPHEWVISLHLANVLKAQGQWDDALQLLQQLVYTHPDVAAVYNNLGTIYFAQQQWQAALQAYQQALQIQADYIDAYYNTGLTLNKLQRYTEAVHAYKALLMLAPNHVGAHFQLACLFMQKNNLSEALTHFLWIAERYPHHFATQMNLAALFLKSGKSHEAKKYYLQALTLTPTDTQLYFNLGVISAQLGCVEEAIDYYLQALKINPDLADVHNNLSVAYLAIKNNQAALQHFCEVLRLQPQNAAVQHTIDILMQKKNISQSPPEYIRSLFDSYANHYEQHLLNDLHYQVPKTMYEIIVENFPQKKFDVLDLGCGTGLCGELFKPITNTLVGVDLSEKMLAVAAQKHIYTELIQAEISAIHSSQQYDLVIAADTLVYVGDWSDIMLTVARALQSAGIFIFNAEISEQENYVMTSSGRFAHHKKYIEKVAAENGFTILQYRKMILRTHNQTAVEGHLYLLRSEIR